LADVKWPDELTYRREKGLRGCSWEEVTSVAAHFSGFDLSIAQVAHTTRIKNRPFAAIEMQLLQHD